MNQGTRDLISWSLGTLISMTVLVGLGVRFILLPYLREHLVNPMKLVKKQVSENHHGNEKPTVLDRLDDVQRDVHTLQVALDGHLLWSEKWVELMDREMKLVRREQAAAKKG